MTVRKLIAELQKADPDLEVELDTSSEHGPAATVEIIAEGEYKGVTIST